MRKPAVSGKFYPADPSELTQTLSDFFCSVSIPECKNPFGVIAPHAGYVFSGKTAALSYTALKKKNFTAAVLLGPNHTGYGQSVSLSDESWKTPLGEMKINTELLSFLSSRKFDIDRSAHAHEHSLEVQLPFLQHCFKNIEIMPVCLRDYHLPVLKKLACDLFDFELSHPDLSVCYIASSDFSHYVHPSVIADVDKTALQLISEGNAEGFYRHVQEEELSICGVLPVTVLLFINQLKKGKPRFLNYTHSGQVYPSKEVVGYASFSFETN